MFSLAYKKLTFLFIRQSNENKNRDVAGVKRFTDLRNGVG